MNINENEIKKEFQLERLIFFSDAVFAIIITIMVLDVKLPEMNQISDEMDSKNLFIRIGPKLLAYCISFFAVGSFWMRHLVIFGYLKDYNKKLLAINLLFLFSISLFPFAQSLVFSNSNIMQFKWGIYIYTSIIGFTFFTQALLIGFLVKNKQILCTKTDEMESELRWKTRRLNLFMVPFFIILICLITYFDIQPYILYTSLMIYFFIVRRLNKRFYPAYKNTWYSFFSLFKRSAKHKILNTSFRKVIPKA